jgi:hypothetical protein
MMMRTIVASLLALALVGCDGGVHLDGKVTDENGTPVSNAHVWLEYPGSEDFPVEYWTADDGLFHLDEVVRSGKYTLPLTIAAKGFKPARVAVPTLTENKILARLVTVESGADSRALLK